MIKKYLSRFPNAFRGIYHALKSDFGFRTQVYLGIFLLVILSLLLEPLNKYEFLFITLGYALVLITELQNSALEAALDKLHPELSDSIKQSKDMAAGAVLIAGVFLLIAVLSIIFLRS